MENFELFITSGGFAWPGGYPMYALCADGEVLCADCCKDNKNEIDHAREVGGCPQWEVVAVAINWEEPDMHCIHCNKRIESAYAEEEEGEQV